MFALLLRYFNGSVVHAAGPVLAVFSIIAIASMLAGNIMGLLQNNVKRILAYSSIAHLGYLLVAFQAAGDLGSAAVTFYLVAYFVTTLGAFGIVTVLSGDDRDADSIEDYRGLFWRRPAVATVFTIMLFSLAGIPATAGFPRKLYRGRRRCGGEMGADSGPSGGEFHWAVLLSSDRRGAVWNSARIVNRGAQLPAAGAVVLAIL